MKEILLKLKKTFWKLELIFLILAVAFLSGSISYIGEIPENPIKIWNLVWNTSFGLLFLGYFLTADNRITRELMRLRFYVYFALMMVVYIILFSIFPEEGASLGGYIFTFVACEIIIIGGIYYSWKDYKKEKLLATKCQGRHTKECNINTPCIMCEEYRGYMTSEEINAAVYKYQCHEAKKLKRRDFFITLKQKLNLFSKLRKKG